MEAASVPAPADAVRARTKTQEAKTGEQQKTPWWMWVGVVAIVRVLPVPVLLAGQHVAQDGAGPVDRVAVPAEPDAGELRVDLQGLELHERAAQQRDRRAGHHRARR